MFCKFSLKLNMVNRRHVFLASEMDKHINWISEKQNGSKRDSGAFI